MAKTTGLLIIAWTIPLLAQSPNRETSPADLELDSLPQIPISAVVRTKQTVNEAPSSVTIITSEDIWNFGHNSPGDVLRRKG